MSDREIIWAVNLIRHVQRAPAHSGIRRAIIDGLIARMEDAGVTEADLDRLGL